MQLDRDVLLRPEPTKTPDGGAPGEGEALDLDLDRDRQLDPVRRDAPSTGAAPAAQSRGAATTPEAQPFAVMGYFTTPRDIYHACEALREAGYQRFDAHTPFPVHGLEKAMGLKPSPMPWIVLVGGIVGLISGVLLAWYTQAVAYPLDISGKPPFAYQAYVPVIFELTILFAALSCFFGLFVVGRLPAFFHPTMMHPAFPRATDDAFFVSVESSDPKFDRAETRRLLEGLGAHEIAEVAP